jgi:hypothetical protein
VKEVNKVGTAKEAENGNDEDAGNNKDDNVDEVDDKFNGEKENKVIHGVEAEDDGKRGDSSNWENSDSNRVDVPESLFSISGERQVPACTMDATKHGAQDQEERDVPVLGISMPWNVERRDVWRRQGKKYMPRRR